jgi:tetratricopeptide (TPR) repeat protein
VLIWAFIAGYFRPGLLFSPVITTGGDTGSHYYTAKYLKDNLLPTGRISGWCPGNLAGFPLLQYYFPLPFVLIAGLSYLAGLPVAFKIGTVLGVFLLPLAAYLFFRLLREPFPVPIAGAVFSLSFLFTDSQSMWGGNIPSTLAGEFCYTLGFSLAVIWLGLLFRSVAETRKAVASAFLLALVGLCHAYALLFAAAGSAYFLLTHKDFSKNLALLVKIHVLAFLLMGFWIIPLLANLPWTTRFNILWVFQSWAQACHEIFPKILWPHFLLSMAALAAAAAVAFRARKRGGRDSLVFSQVPFIFFLSFCGLALYLVGYRGRVVDVRFLPFFQFFLVVAGAVLCRYFFSGLAARILLAGMIVLGSALWVDENARGSFIASWIRGNYTGFESKPLWPRFLSVNKFLSGDEKMGRVVYEHSLIHDQAGTVRAFEDLPLFSGRSTLEGVYIQGSVPVPYIFYLQSEISQQPSTPIPDFCYSRFNPDRAFLHFGLFNVTNFIGAEAETKAALARDARFLPVHDAGPYRVYALSGADGAYVETLKNRPVLLPRKNFRENAYTWFRTGDLSVIPVFEDGLSEDEKAQFLPATVPEGSLAEKTAAIRNFPAIPVTKAGTGNPRSTLSSEEISISGAAPGVPLLVKVSYHPGWRVRGAKRIYLAGPGFMLIFPNSAEIRLTYGKTFSDYLGTALSLAALLWILSVRLSFFAGISARLSGFLDRHAARIFTPFIAVMLFAAAVYLGPMAPEFPATPFNRAIASFTKKDYIKAAERFRQVLERHPQSLVADEAAYHLAMCYFNRRDFAGARQAIESLLELYPETRRAAEALYHIGLCRLMQNEKDKARAAFDETIRRFPGSNWAGFARDREREF